ncbi:MAG: hypothetical protein COA61_004050 [Zetaproteobacteria bacterium]|nr:hypothetical protein [Zetaproteobacteria bacterium]
MPDVFVWYHADAHQERKFQQWLTMLENKISCTGKLYKRKQDEKTTFMEVFEHIDSATMKKIEQLATQQDCFQGIHRQCESFERILSL